MSGIKINPVFEDLNNPKILEIYKFNYRLYYSELELNDNANVINFDELTELVGFALVEVNIDVVYLISVFGRVFVSEVIADVLDFAENFICKKYPLRQLQSRIQNIKQEGKQETINIFLQEYPSYEEAYKVALNMYKISPL